MIPEPLQLHEELKHRNVVLVFPNHESSSLYIEDLRAILEKEKIPHSHSKTYQCVTTAGHANAMFYLAYNDGRWWERAASMVAKVYFHPEIRPTDEDLNRALSRERK